MNKMILGVSIFVIGISFSNAEVVKGYTLPPEPNKALNNSTLLGIDSNKNMLRDDVERWMVNQPWSHKRIAAGLQKMRGLQILTDEKFGSYKKRSVFGDMTNNVYRAIYNSDIGKILDENKQFRRIIFNTPERRNAYREYDKSFSGTIIHGLPRSGKFSYKYADYTMENSRLSSYKFNGDIYSSEEKIPNYSSRDGLINSFWSLEENKRIKFKGNWSDKFCEVNFGIPRNNIECGKAKTKYKKDLKKGKIK